MRGFNVINNLDTELKEMNKNKVGLRAISLSKHFSSSAWMCQSILSSFILTNQRRYCTREHAKGKIIPSIPDFTTINIEEQTD